MSTFSDFMMGYYTSLKDKLCAQDLLTSCYGVKEITPTLSGIVSDGVASIEITNYDSGNFYWAVGSGTTNIVDNIITWNLPESSGHYELSVFGIDDSTVISDPANFEVDYTYSVLYDFNQPDGALGSNWTNITTYYNSPAPSPACISSNTFYIPPYSSVGNDDREIGAISNFNVVGNAEITVDFASSFPLIKNRYGHGLYLWHDINNYIYIGQNTGGYTWRMTICNMVFGGVGFGTYTLPPYGDEAPGVGKLRIKRVGNTFTCYYNYNSVWHQAATGSAALNSSLKIKLSGTVDSNNTYWHAVNYDNLYIVT